MPTDSLGCSRSERSHGHKHTLNMFGISGIYIHVCIYIYISHIYIYVASETTTGSGFEVLYQAYFIRLLTI